MIPPRFLRFCVVGGSSYFVNLAVYAASLHALSLSYYWSAIVAFVVAVAYSYALHRSWTYRQSDRPVSRGIRYLAVSVGALGLNLLVLTALVSIDTPALGAQAFSILALFPLRYVVNTLWTFRKLAPTEAA
jgi:putative flippase GtrA